MEVLPIRGNPTRARACALALAFLLAFLAAGTLPAAAEAPAIGRSFTFSEPVLTANADGTASVELEGLPRARSAGLPVLPSTSFTVALPPGTRATGVTVLSGDWTEVPGTYLVEWGQPPAPGGGKLPERVPADPSVYGSDDPYPARPAELASSGAMRKVSLATVRVSPVRYHPASGVLEACSGMTVRVEYSGAPDLSSASATDGSPARIEPVAENSAQAEQWYDEPSDTKAADTADYVIITTEALSAATTPLADYREALGLSVNVTTTEWIYSNSEGADNPEKIRNFLEDRYLSWGIDYVLIAGSDASVPMRRACADSSDSYDFNVPTDYYYSDLSGDWDLNDNSRYGEYGIDDAPGGVDFYPEVLVGRIPTDDAAEVTAICEKTVAYCCDAGAWKHRVLLPEAVSNFQNQDGSGYDATFGSCLGEEIKANVATPPGYSCTTLYEKEGLTRVVPPVSPDPQACDLPLTKANVLSEWEDGYGVVTWWGHGNYSGAYRSYWSNDNNLNNIPETTTTPSEIGHAQFIGNSDVLPDDQPAIVFACSCLNGEPERSGNLGATLLDNGAVAVVAGSRVTWYSVGWEDHTWGGNSTIAYLFTDYLLSGGGFRAGEALRLADVDELSFYGGTWLEQHGYANLYGFNLYGDPAVRLEAEGPTVSSVTPDSIENTGAADLTVQGNNFQAGAQVKIARSGRSDVEASAENVGSATELTCTVDVDDLAYGDWDIVVTNPDAGVGVLNDGLNLYNPVPTVTGITPSSARNDGVLHVTDLEGTNFRSTAEVQLRRSGQPSITATNVARVSDTRITCDFNLAGRAAGAWDVFVENGGNRNDTLEGALTIDEPPGPDPEPEEQTPTWYLAEGTSDWGFDTYVTIENPNDTALTAQVAYMTPDGERGRPDVPLDPSSQTVINPRSDIGITDFSTKVTCKEGETICVDRRMIWQGQGASSQEGHSSVGVTSPAKTWYMPEGSSKWGFETWLLIQNPNPQEATCTVTYMIEGQGPAPVRKTVPANSRSSFNMADDIGAQDASIKVESDVPVIPERAMYRNNRREGHDSIGTTTPAKDYYLAEGTTDWGFTTYVLIQNPDISDNTVTITCMTPRGPVAQDPFVVPAGSRRTICVNNVPGVGRTDCSIQVSGSLPLIAERAMYWDGGTGEACHDSIGLSSPHTTFYLPDGETYNGCETWTLVQNPNAEEVTVRISYLTPDGTGNVVFDDSIPGNSRKTYNMADRLGAGRAAIIVTSRTPDRKIMCERAMYWNDRGAGTDTIGGYSH